LLCPHSNPELWGIHHTLNCYTWEPRASGLCPVLNLCKKFRGNMSVVKKSKRNYRVEIKHIFSTTLHSPPEPEKKLPKTSKM